MRGSSVVNRYLLPFVYVPSNLYRFHITFSAMTFPSVTCSRIVLLRDCHIDLQIFSNPTIKKTRKEVV